MGNCCGTEAGSKEHVYIFWQIFFIRNFKIFQIFLYDLAEIISVLDGYKLRYRDIFLMADSYTDKVIFSTFWNETRTSDDEFFRCRFFTFFIRS